MLLTSDVRYLIQLGQKNKKYLKQKNENKGFHKNLLVHSLKIFFQKSICLLDAMKFYVSKENDFLSFLDQGFKQKLYLERTGRPI